MPQIEELTLDDLMELASVAFPARDAGVPKVQMDSAHAVSLIALAAKSHRQAALIASHARRIEELEAVYDAARGLCYGEDWNNGTHAKSRGYRKKLVAAVNAIEPLPPRDTLKGET